jgi:pimeloyl-[acyl-carrier protein] methyl ester esterase
VSAVLGTHPDLALIHGWGIGSAVWQPLIEPLASTWRVHLVDLPGYAGAAESSADFTATAQALIDHLPDGVTLCGWSLGAMLALRATLLAPQRVAGLLLVGATASFCQREGWSAAQAPELLDSFSESVRAEPQQTLQRFAALICQGDRQSRSLLRLLLACLRNGGQPTSETLHRGLDWLREVDLRPQLSTIATRTLLIHGKNDRLNPVAAAYHLSTSLPAARLEVFGESGHAPFLADPDRFIQLVNDFHHVRPAP